MNLTENIDISKLKEIFPFLEVLPQTLYIVSTPIGNLSEISFRALYILSNVDFITCEDTRNTSILLKKYEINTKMVSYYSQNESHKTEHIINDILEGKSAALLSDAGTPGISDPGSRLINGCINQNIKVISVPGASALMHGLVLSGFENKKFFFQGFLPHKGRENQFERLKKIKMPIVIYESKFRIKKTLIELSKIFPSKDFSVGRELSKIFESIYDFKGNEVQKFLKNIKEKGEFVIVINNV